MKRSLMKNIYILIAALMVFVMFPVSAQASQVILAVSGNDIKVGDSFTVSMTGASSSKMSLHYDGTMVTPKSMNGASLDGNTLTVTARSVSFTFEAKQAGGAGFVASSDAFAKSSVVVNIAEAAENTQDKTVQESEKKEETDKKPANDTNDKDKSSQSSSSSEKSKSTSSDSSTADNDTKKPQPAQSSDSQIAVSSDSLTFRQLITDRRMILVTGVLLAIIIALIIRITVLRSELGNSDYGTDDIDFDDNEEKIRAEEKRLEREIHEEPEEIKNVPLEDLEIDEAKLTMPKPPKKPATKLRLEDLNDL